ncbi:hypothetical protein L2E82_48209 [Cichorium intybus]|uniref:Uncharacterized protein n=1 Tax=Cichorium intybus TaxID=13427 RepID=A0ACB8YWW6_CICIN|nr:hypothetical protein L2E82_48209 [Cichorium intybus]
MCGMKAKGDDGLMAAVFLSGVGFCNRCLRVEVGDDNPKDPSPPPSPKSPPKQKTPPPSPPRDKTPPHSPPRPEGFTFSLIKESDDPAIVRAKEKYFNDCAGMFQENLNKEWRDATASTTEGLSQRVLRNFFEFQPLINADFVPI